MPLKAGKFPYAIKEKFNTQEDARRAGWTACRTWAVFENQHMIGYAPPHHQDGVSHYVVTNEQHDCASFYEQEKE